VFYIVSSSFVNNMRFSCLQAHAILNQ
jgi:hypothetical protein